MTREQFITFWTRGKNALPPHRQPVYVSHCDHDDKPHWEMRFDYGYEANEWDVRELNKNRIQEPI